MDPHQKTQWRTQLIHKKEEPHTALGKAITDFMFKITSLTFTVGSGESLDVQGNLEGTATGFGPVLGTAAFTNAGERAGRGGFAVWRIWTMATP